VSGGTRHRLGLQWLYGSMTRCDVGIVPHDRERRGRNPRACRGWALKAVGAGRGAAYSASSLYPGLGRILAVYRAVQRPCCTCTACFYRAFPAAGGGLALGPDPRNSAVWRRRHWLDRGQLTGVKPRRLRHRGAQ
jgi:hypothetical protein